METRFSRPGLIVFLFLILAGAIPTEARLGITKEDWEAQFGSPDAGKVYRWEGPGRRGRGGPFLLMIRVEEGLVTGIQVRRESGFPFQMTPARELIAALRQSEEHPISLRDALSEDGKMLTLLIPKKEAPPAPIPGVEGSFRPEAVMGQTWVEWEKALGKPDDEGFHTSGPYRLQTASNRNSGKVDWIKVRKTSGATVSEEEAGALYQALTGRKREEVSNPPSLHDEGKFLLMTKPKKK